MTLNGVQLQVGGYRRTGVPAPPTGEVAHHAQSVLMHLLRDVLADGEHQAPNADVAWAEPLRATPQKPTPVSLMTTDGQCAPAAEEAQPHRANGWWYTRGQASPCLGGCPATVPYLWPQDCPTTHTWHLTLCKTSLRHDAFVPSLFCGAICSPNGILAATLDPKVPRGKKTLVCQM